jgi:hypothetical protein
MASHPNRTSNDAQAALNIRIWNLFGWFPEHGIADEGDPGLMETIEPG